MYIIYIHRNIYIYINTNMICIYGYMIEIKYIMNPII